MNVYAFITPIVLILFIIELVIIVRSKKRDYPFQDMIANLGTGIGNQCINLAVAFFVFHWYGFLYELTPFRIEYTWFTFIILLLLQDFIFYWFHRLGHTVNIFWAAHMAHHSSEEMNLSVGLRASFTQRLFQFLFFDWILVLIGFSPELVYAAAAVHLVMGYWHHTELIRRMGWFEILFVAPAHHRVHHGVNPQYIDKNYAELLIIWDKIFGTFEDEQEEVCYGVTHPPRTWHPIAINFQYWKQLVDDARATPYVWDKFRIWFMPTGWRPRGLGVAQNNEAVGYTKAEQVKYESIPLKNSQQYLVAHLIIGLVYMAITTNMKLPFEALERILMSAGIFMMIVAWGAILESKSWAKNMEMFRLLFMGFVMGFALVRHDLAEIAAWPIMAILLIMGASILYLNRYIQSEESAQNSREDAALT